MKITLKAIAVLLIIPFWTINSQAQSTFSIRTTFGLRSAVMSSMKLVGDTLQCMGFVTEYEDPLAVSAIYAEYSLQGDSLTSFIIRAQDGYLQAQHHGFDKSIQSLEFLSRTLDTSSYFYVTRNKVDLVTNELTQTHFNGFYETDSTKFTDAFNLPIVEFERNNLNSLFYGTRTPEPLVRNQIGMLVFNAKDSLIGHHAIGDLTIHNTIYFVEAMANLYYVGCAYVVVNVSEAEEVIFKSEIYVVDQQGQILDHWIQPTDELQQGARALVPTDDGGIVVASCQGSVRNTSSSDPPRWGYSWRNGLIYKLDSTGNIVWRTVVPGIDSFRTHLFVEDMIGLPDGSGYVMAGQVETLAEGPVDDTVYLGWDLQGWLVKVDPEGELLWERHITAVDPPWNFHAFREVVAAPDGGVIAVGMSMDSDASIEPQQAWIVRTDEYGCIVPGCHLSSTEDTEGPIASSLSIQMYPNPASDVLAIYVGELPDDEIYYRMYSMQGQLVKEFSTRTPRTTYLLSVADLLPGAYVLTASGRSGILASEQVVVQR